MMLRVALVICLVVFADGQARAVSRLPEVYAAYAGCMDGVAENPAFAQLAASGFFAGVAAADRPRFVTPAQAALLRHVQAAAAVCEVDLRTALENLDTGLADRAAQARQLNDVNELMLFNRAEDWADYVSNRDKIDGDFWRAAQAAAQRQAAETALGDNDANEGAN
jgi:hypothetical protein